MFLEAISAVSLPSAASLGALSNLPNAAAANPNLSWLSGSSCFRGLVLAKKSENGFVASASSNHAVTVPLAGVVFHPFEEVKKEELAIPIAPDLSIARHKFSQECESAINEQIKFFKEASIEEREHAEKLMEYQNKRGGRVKLFSLQMPPAEFDHVQKGDALHAMELALSLEKLTNEKLLKLHSVADANNDPQLADFVESEFLGEQVEAIKKISEYISQLRRVGKGHGVWHFDQMLLQGEGAV
ncbi:ferritin-2, chloroplastic-like isoform X2 [Salvia splendens]|uniref:ferritin-2, chloroplastic-like isoform X2 n=1 Tax=Salvia splendens TaxID=180675 RepID=UPI001C25ED75|nr:ferritin-2, chloroplastic-like isoform X2 [Salvia splendens]